VGDMNVGEPSGDDRQAKESRSAKKPIRVLVVEDSEFDARILVGTLKQGGYDPAWQRVETSEAMVRALEEESWDVILSDYNLPDFSAPAALRLLQQSGLDLPFLIISGGIGEDVAVASMKAGAHDYLMKGNLARLVPAVEREMREAEVRRSRRQAEEALRDSEQRYRLLWENSTDAVLLMDEGGVVRFANPAARDVFGHDPSELIGWEFGRLLDVVLKGLRSWVAFIRDITERRRAEEESRLLQTISVAVNAAQDLDTALQLVLRTVCEATGWAIGQAWLPTRDHLVLQWTSAWHRPDARLARFRAASQRFRFRPGEGLPGRVWESLQPVWLPNLGQGGDMPRGPVAREVGVIAAVGIPVVADEMLVAAIEFLLMERRRQDERMIRLFSAIAAQLGGVIQRKRAEQELRATEEEFRAAREIQQHLFPKESPELPGFDIAGWSHPASAAGGDYFDYLPMLLNRRGIVVGDVTGHGIGPALLMAETRAYLRVLAMSHEDPGGILTAANRVLADDIGIERFITLLLVCLDPRTRTLHYANAGHPSGYILNAAGDIKTRLVRTGVPLGVKPEADYPAAREVSLDSGDLILLLTDGIDEAVSPKEELFGIERVLAVVRERRTSHAIEVVEALYQAVRQFSERAPQLDDATVVVIRVL
jgi:phosphoserine phosphatase RsbU/P